MSREQRLRDVGWMVDAACKDQPTELFFEHTNTRAAIEICNRCVVKNTCLEWRLDTLEPLDTDYGVWGGTRPSERTRMRYRRSRV